MDADLISRLVAAALVLVAAGLWIWWCNEEGRC